MGGKKNDVFGMRAAALVAAVCTLSSLTIAVPANAADNGVASAQTSEAQTSAPTNQATQDSTVQNNAANAVADAAASVATVTSNGQTTSYGSLSAALNAAQNGDTVTLTADSSENVRVEKKITVTSANGAVYSATMSVHDGATITGMHFTLTGDGGNNANLSIQGAGDVKITNNTFDIASNAATNRYYGIFVQQGSARISISENTFNYATAKNRDRTAIYITGENGIVKNVTIEKNTMQVTGSASDKGLVVFIDAVGGQSNDHGVTNLTVTENIVSASEDSKARTIGMYMQGVDGVTFIDNEFTNLSQAIGSGQLPGQEDTSININVGGNDFTNTNVGYGFGAGTVPSGGLTITKPDKVEASRPVQGIAAAVKKAGTDMMLTYANLADAINAAAEGDTVQLLSNVVLTSSVTISKKITLDGQGYTLNSQATELTSQITLDSNASGSTIQNVRFLTKVTSTVSNAAIHLNEAAGVTIVDNTFDSGDTGIYLAVKTGANDKINVKHNTFRTSNAVVVKDGASTADALAYAENQASPDAANTFGATTIPYTGNAADSTANAIYGVTYRDIDQSLLDWEEVANGSTVQNAPAKAGYTVTWYTDANKTTVFDPAKDTVTKNLTLYAVWTSNVTPTPTPDLTVSNLPTKVEYRIGEKFDAAGMKVTYQGSELSADKYTVTFDSSKPGKVKVTITLNADTSKTTSFEVTVVVSDVTVYRLYNPNTGEHFYTASKYEYDVLSKNGWNGEKAVFTMTDYGTAVYRLYNPNGGMHVYTTSAHERDVLKNAGWNDEGTAFYVPEEGKTKVYRLYNPGNGDHLLTTNANERGFLLLAGWTDEKVAFTAK